MAAAAASIGDAIEEVLDKIQESTKCQLPATKQDGGRGAPFLAVSLAGLSFVGVPAI